MGNLLGYVPDLQKDDEIINIAIETSEKKISIDGINTSLDNVQEFIKKIIVKNGMLLSLVSDTLKNNKEIVQLAVQQNGLSLQYASTELKNNKEIVQLAVQQNGFSLEYASTNLKYNQDIVQLAYNQDNSIDIPYELQNKIKKKSK